MKLFKYLVFIILFLTGCSNNFAYCTRCINLDDQNAQSLKNKIDTKDSFILFVSLRGCGICVNYGEVIDQYLIDNTVDIYYIEHSYLKETFPEFIDILLDKCSNCVANLGFPITTIIIQGEIIYYKAGILNLQAFSEVVDQYLLYV